jgi:hypothetical protein
MQQLTRLFVVVFAVSIAAPAMAQPAEWTITPYAWLAGFDGTLGTEGTPPGLNGGRIDVDTSGVKLKQVGAMLHVNWRQGRISAFGDWTYANVKADSPTPFATLYAGTDVKVRGNIVEANVGYDLLPAADSHVDVFGGVRFYDLHLDLALRQGTLPGASVGGSSSWADGVVGVRAVTRFADKWQAFASADVGGGGSDLAWQLYGGVGYQFSWGSIIAGYRHLHVNYVKNSYKLDGALTGPLIGASFRF